ncbi:MAG: glycosyltransferase [Gorillibacterium sp.]|nr:glycosyltransferase [Gorillibacterium sp.]
MADVGVVMPVYTQKPEFLRQALESILSQTLTDYRLVIVIDGDPAMEPLVKLSITDDHRVTLISNARNRGVAYTLNAGFEILFNDPDISYLTWVSSDNVYEPDFLEVLRATLVKGPQELGIAYSSFQSIDNEGKPLMDEDQLAIQRQYQSQPKEKLLDSSIIGVSFMYKLQVAKQVGGYGMEPVEDYDYWLRLSEHCEICYIPMELVNYRVNSTYSVSKQLLTSENHRKWRYTYHLARHQARTRRGILPILTVLFPVVEVGQKEIARIENLYEQTFSNYECKVLDLSLSYEPSAQLGFIQHPVTGFIWIPGAPLLRALCKFIEKVKTPFTMILGPAPFGGQMDLEFMIEELTMTGQKAISSFYTDNHSSIEHRYKGIPSTRNNFYNELFRSEDLRKLLDASLT